MYAKRYLESTINILNGYSGEIPFHLYLKKYFSANKKYGSKDRKQITSLCYNYFRLGHSFKNIPVEERIVLATFFIETNPSAFLESVKPEWNALVQKSLIEKLCFISTEESIQNIFPFEDELSEDINAEKFASSFLIQPDLFLRVRPGNHKRVTGKLSGAGISYKKILEDCLVLNNASKMDDVLELDKEAVVQDYNSQRVAELMKLTTNHKQQSLVWDCCAASGGKSIMAYDFNPNIQLSVSDKRESILQNLHKRFATAGITKYHSFVVDLTNSKFKIQNSKFDLIICDAPCSGSGTWSRTPEQLFYFKKDSIVKYATLQKQILQNVIQNLKPSGKLLYITCSVFKKENEEIVKFVQEELKLNLERSEMFIGYESKADTLFAALFTAPKA